MSMCGKFQQKAVVELMSRGQPHRSADSQKRTLGRCNSRGYPCYVIDVESCHTPGVIIIDGPESSESTSAGVGLSERQRTQADKSVICIDDDEDDDEGDDVGSQNGLGCNRHQAPDFMSGEEFSFASKRMDGCPPVYEFSNAQSACKWRTASPVSSYKHGSCSRSNSSAKQQNLHNIDENSDSDSDCEVLDFRNIFQAWQKASSSRKKLDGTWGGPSGSQAEVTAERFSPESRGGTYIGKTDVPNSTSSDDLCHKKADLSQPACHCSNSKFKNMENSNLNVNLQPETEHKASDNCEVEDEVPSEARSIAQSQVNPAPSIVADDAGPSPVENSIIGDRELLKKTDSYQHAQEEEWAARQTELRIQAEEAQRMRKRKKAENLRLLEMERRQKQRVEEVREANKKDEETSNLKEQLRSQVRRELHVLEAKCKDMATLLQSLGIPVSGGVDPSWEVRAAFKQALIRFHPDRASRSDIRQQIEAEEKFKLISRAKERFSL